MKIIFFGSSSYCLPILESLKKNFDLTAIITKSDSSPQSFALSKYVKEFTPKNTQELMGLKEKITKLNSDLAIVADYGLIIPKDIFSLPYYKTLNIHFSKLPKFRGPSPVQYTLLNGEISAWISIIIMDAQIDTGDIVWQQEVKLEGNETTDHLYQMLFNIVATELPKVLSKYVQNELKPQKQDNYLATYTKHLTREDGYIPPHILAAAINCRVDKLNITNEISDWRLLKNLSRQLPITRPRRQAGNYQLPIIIDRACRALSPWPGLWTTVQITDNKQQITKRLKILKVHLVTTTNDQRPTTKLVPDLVQLEGKKPVTWKQFLEGHPGFMINNL